VRSLDPEHMRKNLGFAEQAALLAIDSYPKDGSINSTTLARFIKQDDYVTSRDRGKVLGMLVRLEARGFIERGDDGTWQNLQLTKLGKTRAHIERIMPTVPRLRKPAQRISALAVEEGRTQFPRTRKHPRDYRFPLLKPGTYSDKIGGKVTKGPFKGYRIYTLTLEERASCPRTCERWHDCYGSNMPYAGRIIHGAWLEARLGHEVGSLMFRNPGGVLVRLHVLGDFYSVEYVRLWHELLKLHPKLAIFGYTAHRLESRIGDAIDCVTSEMGWQRFAIRFSSSVVAKKRGATWYREGEAVPAGTFACPEQTGKARSCGECGACWNGEKSLSFHLH